MLASFTLLSQPPRRIAVLRALQLGDLLCAVPTLRVLRQAWPSAEITLVGLPWAKSFAERFSAYVDRFVEFPGYPGLPEREPQWRAIPGFLAEMQAAEFDLAIQLHGSGRFVNEIVALFTARHAAGFFQPGDYCPDRHWFAPWPQRGLEVHRLLALAAQWGLPIGSDELEFPLTPTDYARLAELRRRSALGPGAYAIVHAGASVPERCWPAEHFAAVADALVVRGLAVVLTGVATEAARVCRVRESMHQAAIDVAGQTDIGLLGALVAEAALVVANDTGISHLAGALETPSVIISTGNNPERWAPLHRERHRVLSPSSDVEPGDVLAEVKRLLDPQRLEPLPAPALGNRSSVNGGTQCAGHGF